MAHGHIFARFAVRNGATRLIEQRQSAPLKIARVFASTAQPGALDVCVMDSSPGLLAGDQHDYEWIVEEGAHVRITTQGATRVHPATVHQRTDPTAHQNLIARVATGATLRLWPEAIIPFRDAIFRSRNEVFLEEGANFSLFECLSAGRIARGEAWKFQSVSLQTLVFGERGPLYCGQNRFITAASGWNTRFSFGDFNHWATLLAFGSDNGAESGASETNMLRLGQDIISNHGIYGDVSSLPLNGGIAVSLLSPRAYEARCAALQIEERYGVSRETCTPVIYVR